MNQKLEYFVPITESVTSGKDFLIRGIAINSTTTRNGITYEAAELEASASTLKNKPILKDHENLIDNIVGRTTENVIFDGVSQSILFEGRIKDKKAQEQIKEGLVTSVSIGAMVKEVEEVTEESADGEDIKKLVARGIDFVELSLVAVPADPNAGFAQAMAEAFSSKNTPHTVDAGTNTSHSQSRKSQKEDNKMAEEAEKSKLETLQDERKRLEEEVEALKVEKLKAQKEELEKEPEEEPVEETEAEPEKEEAKEEPAEVEDKTQGEVPQEEEETKEESTKRYTVEKADGLKGDAIVLANTEGLNRLSKEA